MFGCKKLKAKVKKSKKVLEWNMEFIKKSVCVCVCMCVCVCRPSTELKRGCHLRKCVCIFTLAELFGKIPKFYASIINALANV